MSTISQENTAIKIDDDERIRLLVEILLDVLEEDWQELVCNK